MNNPKDKAELLVNLFRIVLMQEDTECGNEILCTSIAKKNALITIDEILSANHIWYKGTNPYNYWQKVKQEIIKL